MTLQSKKKIYGLLHTIIDEQEARKSPLSITFSRLAKFFKTSIPNAEIIKKVTNDQGFFIRPSYIQAGQWKSNAPPGFFYELMKAWRIREMTKKKEDIFKFLEPGSPAYLVLNKPLKYERYKNIFGCVKLTM